MPLGFFSYLKDLSVLGCAPVGSLCMEAGQQPIDLEAERTFLGGLMLATELNEDHLRSVQPEDFMTDGTGLSSSRSAKSLKGAAPMRRAWW